MKHSNEDFDLRFITLFSCTLFYSYFLKVTLSEIRRSQVLLNNYRKRKEKERLDDEAQSNVIIRKIYVKSLNNDLKEAQDEQVDSIEEKLEQASINSENEETPIEELSSANDNSEEKKLLKSEKLLEIEDLDIDEHITDEKAA